MELKDFVAATLTQICEGIEQAKKETSGLGAKISPPVTSDLKLIHDGERESAQLVHFDVLLSSEEGENSEGGLTLLDSVLSVGAKKGSVENTSLSHRVSFDVPVIWPSVPAKKEKPSDRRQPKHLRIT